MGQLGITEMMVIFIIALLVFGPKKLPELGKSLGKGIREFRKHTEELKSSWDDQMRDVENPIKEVSRDIQDAANNVTNDFYSSPTETTETTTAPEPDPTAETSPSVTTGTDATESQETALPKEHV